MTAYEYFLNNADINMILDSINEMHGGSRHEACPVLDTGSPAKQSKIRTLDCFGNTTLAMTASENLPPSCHGRGHAMFVVEKAEHVLQLFACDSRTIELGKIAALLHDIGNIAGRKNHARKSAALAEIFLDGTDLLQPSEKDIIVKAIADHSDGAAISSAVGAALIIADKVDHVKRRIFPTENLDPWHRNLLEIEDVDVRADHETLTVNFITTSAFSQKVYLDDYRLFGVLTGAAGYFNRGFTLFFNGRE